MIQINIIDSIDRDKIGSFTFHKNLIYIGNTFSADVFLKDDNLLSNYVFIEIVDGKLLVHLNKEVPFILINGKRTTGHKFINIGDTIGISDNKLKIEAFIETKWDTMKDIVNKNTDILIQEKSELLTIVSSIQKEA